MGHLTIIMGCMFAQKTTELIRYIQRFHSIGYNVLTINHSVDTRYGVDCIASHDERTMEANTSDQLAQWDEAIRSGRYQAVAIDEAQFFPDLWKYVTQWADECPVSIVVAGLDGTFEREPFGDLLRLIPHAEEVVRLSAYCAVCRNGTKAVYSRRKPTLSCEEETLLVGGKDAYEPVCRVHWSR